MAPELRFEARRVVATASLMLSVASLPRKIGERGFWVSKFEARRF